MLRFVDEANAARVLVKWARFFHRARMAVEGKRFYFRMFFSPLGKCATDTAFVRDVETCGKFADIVQNEDAAGRECGIPMLELSHRRLIFVRAVHNDQLRIAA